MSNTYRDEDHYSIGSSIRSAQWFDPLAKERVLDVDIDDDGRVYIEDSRNDNRVTIHESSAIGAFGSDMKAAGAEGDGATDDTAAFVSALTGDANVVFVPPGDYVVEGPITLPAGVRIVGAGPQASTVKFQGTTGFRTEGRTDNWTIEELGIEDAQGAVDTVGIDVEDYSSYYTIRRCRINGFGQHGIHHSGLAWTVSQCRLLSNGGNTTGTSASVRLSDRVDVPTTGQYDQVYLQSGGEYGFLLQRVRQVYLSNCIGEYHSVAFRAEDSSSIFVDGFWPEQNDATDPVQAHDSNVLWKSEVGAKPVHTWSGVGAARRYSAWIDRLDAQFRDLTVGRDLDVPENPSITPVIDEHEDTAATQAVNHTFAEVPESAEKVILEGTYSRTASGFGELRLTLNGTATAEYAAINKDGTASTRAYWPIVRVGQETSGVPFRAEIGTDDGTISVDSGGVDPAATVSGYLPPVSGVSSIEIASSGDTYDDGTVRCSLFDFSA